MNVPAAGLTGRLQNATGVVLQQFLKPGAKPNYKANEPMTANIMPHCVQT
jgi:hypothetical protein